MTQTLAVGPNEQLTDRSESHRRDLRGPGELPWPPPSRRWGLGGGRAAGGGAGASRPAPSHPVWPGRRRNCVPLSSSGLSCVPRALPAPSYDSAPLTSPAPTAAAAAAQGGGVPGGGWVRNRKSCPDPPSGDPGEEERFPGGRDGWRSGPVAGKVGV